MGLRLELASCLTATELTTLTVILDQVKPTYNRYHTGRQCSREIYHFPVKIRHVNNPVTREILSAHCRLIVHLKGLFMPVLMIYGNVGWHIFLNVLRYVEYRSILVDYPILVT